ncbi:MULTISPECIES: thiamine-phosphate kinase [unclassified Pseudodesulfovibrio]|uniref:thiamine-phosphate kinase n=1 Tax=unclassified Pseudodesulfovibrio TaxID=2661612 RepID=UPI000FEBAD3E|nr:MULTISPECIES: thiamine-phosphate kinase [unclassified Pseudodesulfovibrio]MCJ2163718.1 thiamine-phosphate kinase [Pseudodesulfovibrio sp. S3-i]RWU06110.1 thiamine-phosphate kinase [Pseudodesulfovibrio sp. S3]
MKSEAQFLELIDTYFPREHDFLTLGRGDDCAVLAGGREYCVSSDIFLEDVHFRRDYFSAADIGYKALAVNVSDIAAMGAKPVAFTLDLMVPPGLDDAFWNDFFKSMSSLAKQNDMVLAGGDLSRSDRLGMSISIYGVAGSTGFLRRGKCAYGDILFTVGDIGLARAGLMALEAAGVKARETLPAAVMAHLRPKPKVMIGTLLNAAGIKGLMDVSDGLARDLPRFLGPNLGADLHIDVSRLNSNLITFAETVNVDPVEFAVLGGEDYALLGAVSPFEAGKAESVPGFMKIGTVTKTPGIILNDKPFTTEGFDHFGK